MESQLISDNIIIETIRSLWRKRELEGAMALVLRIPELVHRKIWEATIIIAKAELVSDYTPTDITIDFFTEIESQISEPKTRIDVEMVKGRIAMTNSNYKEAEDLFFKALLASRESEYLLGKVQSMIGLGRIKLLNNNFEQALDLVITADSLTQKLDITKKVFVKSEVLLLQCSIHLSVQDFDNLRLSAQQLLELSEECGETHKYLHALNHIAVVYASKGDLKTAMPYFLEALDICRTINYQNLAAKISTNIATLHAQLQNFNEALDRYHYILDEYNSPIRPEDKATIYNNIGNLYIRLEEWKKAVGYFFEAEAIADKKDHQPLKRLAYCQIARCLVESKSYHALVTHLKSEEEIFHGHPYNGMQILHFVKAKFAFINNDYPNTIRYAKLAIDLASSFTDDTTTLGAMNVLAQAYEEKGDVSSALKLYKRYTLKKEELEKERVKNRITNTEIDYILAAKEKEIDTLQRENQLQSELIKSTSLIRRKNKELIAKNEELSFFAKMIAVDFNKHLRVGSQFTPLLEQTIDAGEKEKTAEYLSYIKNAIHKVSGLIDGLHKYAFIVEDEIQLKEIAIEEVFKVIKHDLKAQIKSSQATISFLNTMPTITCSKAQLNTIFKEILQNALKFSEGAPKIEIEYREEDGDHVFVIRDHGVGIPKKDLKKIFWAFYRSKRLAKKEGNGLGLAACKNIVEKCGGYLKASLPDSGGLAISILLPKTKTN